MALHDRIFKTGRVATVTLATSATLDRDKARTVASVATVAVAGGDEKEIDSRQTDQQSVNTESTPEPCKSCNRFEAVEIQGMAIPGCLYTAPGPYSDGWRRLPADLDKCLFH